MLGLQLQNEWHLSKAFCEDVAVAFEKPLTSLASEVQIKDYLDALVLQPPSKNVVYSIYIGLFPVLIQPFPQFSHFTSSLKSFPKLHLQHQQRSTCRFLCKYQLPLARTVALYFTEQRENDDELQLFNYHCRLTAVSLLPPDVAKEGMWLGHSYLPMQF